LTLSDYIWRYLYDLGVKTCFYLPGGGSMYLIDALARQDKIEPVCMLHEQSCAIASNGFNQYYGYLASVVCVTTGPGGTNAITGVTASWIDHTPLLVISGQVPTHMMLKRKDGVRQKGPQEVVITQIVRPIVKEAFVTVKSNNYTCWGDVFRLPDKYPQGPVWIDIPLDIQGSKI